MSGFLVFLRYGRRFGVIRVFEQIVQHHYRHRQLVFFRRGQFPARHKCVKLRFVSVRVVGDEGFIHVVDITQNSDDVAQALVGRLRWQTIADGQDEVYQM